MKSKKVFKYVDKVDNILLPYLRILKNNLKYKDSISYIKLIKRPLGEWLAVESEAMVNLYTKSTYIKLNKALRGLGVKLDKEYKAMQKVLDDALEKLPISGYNKSHTLLRSTYFTEKEIKKLFKEGKDFIDKGYFSTTYSEVALLRWMKRNPTNNVIFKVYGKNGKLIEASSAVSHEAEILFKSGTKFIVESVKKVFKNFIRNTLDT